MDQKQEAIEKLKKYHQEHIINILEMLEEQKQKKLIEQVLTIDFEQIEKLYEDTKKGINVEVSELKPIKSINPDKLSQEQKKAYE